MYFCFHSSSAALKPVGDLNEEEKGGHEEVRRHLIDKPLNQKSASLARMQYGAQ
jgi:hypothetical protein